MLNEELVSISRIGKSGYPTINANDLKSIRIPLKYDCLIDTEFNKEIENLYKEKLKTIFEMNQKKQTIESNIKNNIINLSK